jgi:hypothetical protein
MERDVRAPRSRGWAWLYLALFGEDGDSDTPVTTDSSEAEEQGR